MSGAGGANAGSGGVAGHAGSGTQGGDAGSGGSSAGDAGSGGSSAGDAGSGGDTGCPVDCGGSLAGEGSPCVAGEESLWYCHGGATPDYEFLSAHCESTNILTPQPGFCCAPDFFPECLNH